MSQVKGSFRENTLQTDPTYFVRLSQAITAYNNARSPGANISTAAPIVPTTFKAPETTVEDEAIPITQNDNERQSVLLGLVIIVGVILLVS
jgi:hypothetical protein